MTRRIIPRLIFALVLAALVGSGPAAAVGLSDEPLLRIEAGLHAGPINALAADSEGRLLATVSYDKTLRLWSADTGKSVRIIRVPIGEDLEGALFGVALSGDGTLAAVAGWTGGWEQGWSLYLFETGTGRMVRRIAGLAHRVVKLAFAPDGRHLAAVMRGKNGVRVFKVADGALAASDSEYDNDAVHLDFAADGRLAVTSLDGQIRLYDRSFARTARLRAANGQSPYGVRFSPDGALLAVGYLDRPQVDVFQAGTDLVYAFSPDLRRADNGSLAHVAWSRDGRTLYAGGAYERGGKAPLRAWSEGGRGSYRETPLAAKRIVQLQPLANGEVAFASSDPAFGVLGAGGRKRFEHRSPLADFRGLADHFAVSHDGKRVALAFQPFSSASHLFQAGEASLAPYTPALGAGLMLPIREAKDVEILDWEHDLRDWGQRRTPTLNGRPLALVENETSLSLAFAPDRQSFLLGTHYRLIRFDRSGKEIWSQRLPGEALAVNVSGDGRLALAALGDGTLRWFRMADGVALLSLFPQSEDGRWVAWTASGYYGASADGDQLVGWHRNRGPDQEADFVPVNAVRAQAYRPAMVGKVLETLDEAQALRQAGIPSATPLARALPPLLRILDPNDNSAVAANPLRLRYAVRGAPGQAIRAIKVLADGRPLHRFEEEDVAPGAEIQRSRDIVVPDRDSELALIVETEGASSPPASVRLLWKGVRRDGGGLKPNLHILAVGVSRYRQTALDLNFAAKDARDIAAAFERQAGRAYGTIEVRLLTDAQATGAALRQGLDWLKATASPLDATMLFLAGHGVDDAAGRYFFLPHDADPAGLEASALSYADLRATLAALPGKAVFFIDSCHSGAALGGRTDQAASDTTRIVNDLKSGENGIIVFASSSGHQLSQESAAWGNGAFTKALIEGLSGSADLLKRGYATAAMLQVYVGDRVRDLTGGAQTPAIAIPNLVPDFPLARF
ncbi:MAG: caspase family protein [Rhodospirillales bacterium]|nr:caspase family protein [Rhodospirillales bacterium]